MTKTEFLSELTDRLASFPESEREKTISYFSEMIDDRIDDGESEEKAISDLGNMDEIVKNIMLDASFTAIIKTKVSKKKKMSKLGTVLFWVGSPLWFVLALAAFSAFVAIYLSIWAIIVAAWTVMASFAVSGLLCIPAAIITIARSPAGAMLEFAAALILIGLSIFMFFAAKQITVGCIKLTGKFIRFVKNLIIGKKG